MVNKMTAKKLEDTKQTKKADVQPQPTPTASGPQPATTTEKKPEPVSKQVLTLQRLTAAWSERKVDLSKMEAKPDGKYLMVLVGPTWPVVRIGNNGGIELPQIRSFPKAFDAALIGDQLLAKQTQRDAKKQAAAQATVAKVKEMAPAAKPAEGKPVTPTQKKQADHSKLEAQLQA
jgi:hypothetical protein